MGDAPPPCPPRGRAKASAAPHVAPLDLAAPEASAWEAVPWGVGGALAWWCVQDTNPLGVSPVYVVGAVWAAEFLMYVNGVESVTNGFSINGKPRGRGAECPLWWSVVSFLAVWARVESYRFHAPGEVAAIQLLSAFAANRKVIRHWDVLGTSVLGVLLLTRCLAHGWAPAYVFSTACAVAAAVMNAVLRAADTASADSWRVSVTTHHILCLAVYFPAALIALGWPPVHLAVDLSTVCLAAAGVLLAPNPPSPTHLLEPVTALGIQWIVLRTHFQPMGVIGTALLMVSSLLARDHLTPENRFTLDDRRRSPHTERVVLLTPGGEDEH